MENRAFKDFCKNRCGTGGIRKERVVAIKTAIIGLGIMGQRMIEQMVLHPEFMVNTIWDPDFATCRRAQKPLML